MNRIAFTIGVVIALTGHGCYRSHEYERDAGAPADAGCGDAGAVWVWGITKAGGELPRCIGPRVRK